MKPRQAYDLIGDIHGHADPLEALLRRLGYEESGASWRHPQGRRVVFLGDYIDRGPAIRRVLRIVRGMVEAGEALAIAGNHEYNAILYHQPDGQGGYLRPHWSKNKAKHAATMEQFSGHGDEWEDHLAWFARLPLWLDLGGLRAVHATWDGEAIAARPEWRIPGLDWIKASAERGSEAFRFAEILLKGMEISLPEGHRAVNKEGHVHPKMRTRWWLPVAGRSFHELSLPQSEDAPRLPVPESEWHAARIYPENAPPVFIGHYWLPWKGRAAPLAPNIAGLDYSVAKPGGALVGYRWDGEGVLDSAKFVPVESFS